jgi:hypothetical protein
MSLIPEIPLKARAAPLTSNFVIAFPPNALFPVPMALRNVKPQFNVEIIDQDDF